MASILTFIFIMSEAHNYLEETATSFFKVNSLSFITTDSFHVNNKMNHSHNLQTMSYRCYTIITLNRHQVLSLLPTAYVVRDGRE